MGFGNIGIELAKRLRPFDVKIIATKRRWSLTEQITGIMKVTFQSNLHLKKQLFEFSNNLLECF